MITVPSLPTDAAQTFISKLVIKGFIFDDGGRDIPTIDSRALEVLERLSGDRKRQIFTHKSADRYSNYEDLEFIGDAALKYTVSQLIEREHHDLGRAWRNASDPRDISSSICSLTVFLNSHNQTLRTRLLNRPCMSRIALALGLQERVLLHRQTHLSQAILEDVIEAIAGAIGEELGHEELYRWTQLTFGPMVQNYRDALVGKFGLWLRLRLVLIRLS